MAIVKERYKIENMMCAMCVAHVQKAIEGCDGVKEANVNLANGTALIEYDAQIVSPEQIKSAVDASGYKMIIEKSGESLASTDEKKN